MKFNSKNILKWTFLFLLVLNSTISCKKFDTESNEAIENNSDLRDKFFNTSKTNDEEIKKLANDIKKQDALLKSLPEFIKKNGIPVWDKTLYKVNGKIKNTGNGTSNSFQSSSQNSTSTEGEQGLFFIPLQSTTSTDIKSYITAYKHDDSLYTYKLFNKDSLNTVQTSTNTAKSKLLNTQAILGVFEKSINNKDSINIVSPSLGTLKNPNINFVTDTSNNIASTTNSTSCQVSISMEITYEWRDFAYCYGGSCGSWMPVSVTMVIEISCDGSNGGGGGSGYPWGGFPTGGGSPTGGGGGGNPTGGSGNPSSGNYWWNYGTGWPYLYSGYYGAGSGGPNSSPFGWDWWWTGGGGTGGGFNPYEYQKSSLDNLDSGDDDNNISGFNDTTSYSPYQIGQPWDTVANVISIADFVGWGTLGIRKNCMDYAKAQIAKNGYQISNYNSPGQTIQIYTTAGGADSTSVKDGIGYLISALNRGIPVVIGIDDDATQSSNPNTDASTDHFVVIVGMGTDAIGNYFSFYDNASGYASQGAHAENKLYFDPATWLISGSSQTSYGAGLTYILTMIRKSK